VFFVVAGIDRDLTRFQKLTGIKACPGGKNGNFWTVYSNRFSI